MRYCKTCVLPSTKPGIIFDEQGICSACRAVEKKQEIDWVDRDNKLCEIINEARIRAKVEEAEYDCVVPVSGGKDSLTQCFVMAKRFDLRVLAVVVVPHLQTSEGIFNLNTLVESQGVDLVRIGVRPSTLKAIRRKAFFELGNPNYAEHRVVFAAVAREAIFRRIPLVVWGEDIGIEFGGTVDVKSASSGDASNLINNDLFHEASDFEDFVNGEISNRDLFFYRSPDQTSVHNLGVRAIYLGFYQWWDGIKHFELARRFGFMPRRSGPLPGNYLPFDNIDEKLCEVHAWLKFPKYGFWRPHDHCSYMIWNGYMSRSQAIAAVKELQYQPPFYLEEFLEYHEISREEYNKYVNGLYNPGLFYSERGQWKLKISL